MKVGYKYEEPKNILRLKVHKELNLLLVNWPEDAIEVRSYRLKSSVDIQSVFDILTEKKICFLSLLTKSKHFAVIYQA